MLRDSAGPLLTLNREGPKKREKWKEGGGVEKKGKKSGILDYPTFQLKFINPRYYHPDNLANQLFQIFKI